MLMPKPMQLTSVNTPPTTSGGLLRAVSALNCGESPETAMPQTIIQARNSHHGAESSQGASRQQMPLTSNCTDATMPLPQRPARTPPTAQPSAPPPMAAKASQDTVGDDGV